MSASTFFRRPRKLRTNNLRPLWEDRAITLDASQEKFILALLPAMPKRNAQCSVEIGSCNKKRLCSFPKPRLSGDNPTDPILDRNYHPAEKETCTGLIQNAM